MKLRDRYIRLEESRAGNPRNLIIISDDSFAICDFIEILTGEIDRLRKRING